MSGQSKSPIIQCLSKFLIGDPGFLDGTGHVGVAELPLNRCDIAGFLDEETEELFEGSGRFFVDTEFS